MTVRIRRLVLERNFVVQDVQINFLTQGASKAVINTGVYCGEAPIYLSKTRPVHLITSVLHKCIFNQESEVSLALGYIRVTWKTLLLPTIFITYGMKWA